MAIALVRATADYAVAGSDVSATFPSAVPANRLLLVYVWRQANSATLPTGPSEFELIFSHLPYEGNKDGGALFAGMSDGSQEMGGVDGAVGPFTPTGVAIASEWTGATDSSATDTDLGTTDDPPGGDVTESRTVTTPAGGLAVMVMQSHDFSPSTLSAAGSSTALPTVASGDPVGNAPGLMVYRLGGAGGSLQNDILSETADPRWIQSSAAAFAPGVFRFRSFGYILG